MRTVLSFKSNRHTYICSGYTGTASLNQAIVTKTTKLNILLTKLNMCMFCEEQVFN